MYGCYMEVVFNVEVEFNFVDKARHHPNLVPVLFSFDIYEGGGSITIHTCIHVCTSEFLISSYGTPLAQRA